MASRRRSPVVLLVLVLASACATNPARRLEPNGVDVTVREQGTPRGLFRGAERLDEQDFYRLTGDEVSENAVKASRATGSTMQAAGVSLLSVGLGAVLFAASSLILSDGGALGPRGVLPRVFDSAVIPYVIGGAGVLATAGGGLLFTDGRARTSGESPLFDLAHAQASLERARYGEEGLKPEHIASLLLATGDGRSAYCGLSGTSLAPVMAKDKAGRAVKIHHHLDWLKWSVEPEGALYDDPLMIGPRREPRRSVASPLGKSIKHLDQDVTVQVSLASTGVATSLTLKQDLTCREALYRWGAPGGAGAHGVHGMEGARNGGAGGRGGAGSDGGDGQPGVDLEVEAAWVTVEGGRRLGLITWATGLGPPGSTLIAPGATFSVVSVGGGGGAGGNGGAGGAGGQSDPNKLPSYCAGNGGAGGAGGNGGRGGPGGRVTVRATDAALLAVITASAPGGNGGPGGDGGAGGKKGTEWSGCQGATNGANGPRGATGTWGQAGTVDATLVDASALTLVPGVLAGAPSLTLERRPPPRPPQ